MQITRFRDIRLAVAAYHAGLGAIVNRTIPQNGETEFYVRKVMSAYQSTRREPSVTLAIQKE